MKSIQELVQAKLKNKKISMVTCYDSTSAMMVAQSAIDMVLVGDSVSMVMHGQSDTVNATLDMMVMHTRAVSSVLKNKLIVGDLPFMSYRKSLSKSMNAVEQLVQAGAQAVKLEGVAGNETLIRHIVDSGVPVMGHIGLTPQHVNVLGGFKVQGKTDEAQRLCLGQARELQDCGCFSIVLECMPACCAKMITESLSIPTIGIGAGKYTDGQVLVFHDLMGMSNGAYPKFVKKYLNGFDLMCDALNEYAIEVGGGQFPSEEYSYKMEEKQ